MIRWPFERAIDVQLLMQSGHVVRFTCSRITISASATNRVEGYSWSNARGAPLFVDHTRIEAVQLSDRWRWAKGAAPDAESDAKV